MNSGAARIVVALIRVWSAGRWYTNRTSNRINRRNHGFGHAPWATISAIRDLAEKAAGLVRETLPRIYSRELINVVFEQPYCRISNIVEAEIPGRQAASRYLKALVSIEMLREQAFGREKLFLNVQLLDLLTRDEDDVDSHSP